MVDRPKTVLVCFALPPRHTKFGITAGGVMSYALSWCGYIPRYRWIYNIPIAFIYGSPAAVSTPSVGMYSSADFYSTTWNDNLPHSAQFRDAGCGSHLHERKHAHSAPPFQPTPYLHEPPSLCFALRGWLGWCLAEPCPLMSCTRARS